MDHFRGWMLSWQQWLSDSPTTARPAPGRIETRYRRIASSISRHPTRADAALALAVTAFVAPQLLFWARHDPTGQFTQVLILSALMVAPLIWRRRYPLPVFAFVAVVALAQWTVDVPLAADVTLLIYLYTVASRYPARVAIAATAVLELGAVMAATRWPQANERLDTFVLLSGPVIASVLLGVTVRYRRNSLTALTERAEQLERERDQQATIAAAAERTRIAREMHDVVAHSLSVMVTMSEAAVLKQANEPERATVAMRQVSATGHQALDEMRRLLGVLRTEEAPESLQPQPDLAQIDGLLEQVRATGFAAELTVTGTPAATSPGAELTVYRIVQEALTNTVTHAEGATGVRVAIDYRPDSIQVDVHDDGMGPGTGLGGYGLIGMRERAAVYGGVATAGPDPAGGWHVHVDLPMTDGRGGASRGAVTGRA